VLLLLRQPQILQPGNIDISRDSSPDRVSDAEPRSSPAGADGDRRARRRFTVTAMLQWHYLTNF
jgi:hypothetical protein